METIYRACDIRGRADNELSPALYRQWGINLGRQLPPTSKFVVGGDLRFSTPAFLEALTEGLTVCGLDVVNVGFLPTPMIYYAKQRLKAAGCAIVTAAHKSAEMNGLKWMIGNMPPMPDEVAAMAKAIEPDGNNRQTGLTRSLDISFDYVASLQERFVDSLGAQKRVIIDPLYGSWAGKARRYLSAIFPQSLIDAIHDEGVPDYRGCVPDCTCDGELLELTKEVYRQRADFGAAFDGDGDRVTIVDEEGMVLGPEETLWILLNCFGKRLHGKCVVLDPCFSDRINYIVKQFGAELIVARGGHAFIRKKMLETNAILGAEITGHYYYRDVGGCDDALYTICLIIEYLSQTWCSLSKLYRETPSLVISPKLKISLPIEQHAQIIAWARENWANFPQDTTDGVKIFTPDGWILVRSLPTETALMFRFESLDWHLLDGLVKHFCSSLPQIGRKLFAQYSASMGQE